MSPPAQQCHTECSNKEWAFCLSVIPMNSHFKYLGLTIDSRLNIRQITNKANSIKGFFRM